MENRGFLRNFSWSKLLLWIAAAALISCYHAPRTAWTPVKPKRAKPDVYPR